MATDGRDTERVAIRTYVPAYQREEWDAAADRLEMSRAEYVRTMVQAGRRDFTLDASAEPETKGSADPSDGLEPRGHGLQTRILEVLRLEGPCEWDELIEAMVDDVEDTVENALEDLKEANRVKHAPRRGGYTVIDSGE